MPDTGKEYAVSGLRKEVEVEEGIVIVDEQS
jgi:hypothetical protein